MEQELKKKGLLCVVLCLLVSYGCGGGGGGGAGDGSETPAPISYTGITTQATITEDNAVELVLMALGAGEIGALSAAQVEGTVTYPRYLKLVQILKDSTENIELSPSNQPIVGAIVTVSDTRTGNCGGSASLTGNLDDQTGDASGTLTFSNYCSNGTTINGIVSFSGIYDLINDEFDVFAMTTDNLSATNGLNSFTVRGTITFDYRNYPYVVTMDILLQDGASGKVYWAEDYVMNVWDYTGHIDFSITGRCYHPDYGYVEVTTLGPIQTYYEYDYPYNGAISIWGLNNTRANLGAVTELLYQVVADINGDGDFTDPEDIDFGYHPWES